jgi:hypothetical protein
MKTSLWDILSIFIILIVVILALVIGLIFANPHTALNPFPPATAVATLMIPTATSTPAALPSTWTPTADTSVAKATPSSRASATPIPTRTPFVLPSPTNVPAIVMPTNERLPLEGRCKVVEQNPADGTRLKFGSEFRAAWTLQNTGESSWDNGSSDVRFMEGKAMQTGPSVIDLPDSVGAGSTTLITITMKVPDTAGYYIAYWSIVEGGKSLCTFYIEIFAEK